MAKGYFKVCSQALLGWLLLGPSAGATTVCGQSPQSAELCQLQQRADRGDADAMQQLGWRYAVGRDVAQNYERAVLLAQQAVAQGHVQAASDLGFYYFNGHGVAQDPLQAERWWRFAAARGEKLALSSLGYQFADKAPLLPSDAQPQYHLTAFQFWLEACSAGDPAACSSVQSALRIGQGVPVNTTLADRVQSTPATEVYPELRAWLTRSQPATVELPAIAAGACHRLEWQRTQTRTMPVFICQRTPQMIERLTADNGAAPTSGADALELGRRYAQNMADASWAAEVLAMQPHLQAESGRSVEVQWFVTAALEPRFGCLINAESDQSGFTFYNPCHGDRWNDRGQPIPDQDAPAQDTLPLMIPPYRIQGSALTLGELPDRRAINYPSLQPAAPAADAPLEQRLLYAARWQDSTALRRLLEQNGEKTLSALPQRGEILIQAVSMQYAPNILMLLEHGFKPTEKTRYGSSALDVAGLLDNHALSVLLKEYLPRD